MEQSYTKISNKTNQNRIFAEPVKRLNIPSSVGGTPNDRHKTIDVFSFPNLDTLVLDGIKEIEPGSKALKKRAVRVHKSKKLMFNLVDLHSSLESSYWRAYDCGSEIIQEGQILTQHYCNTRWCFECNAIRSAKMINGYSPVFKGFKYPQFVTLSRPNVPGGTLEEELTELIKTNGTILNYLRHCKKIKIQGLRKIEITYNPERKTYHIHFHYVLDSLQSAKFLYDEWMFRNPTAGKKAQDIRPADQRSLVELFKYATKSVVDPKTPPEALDTIFRALNGKQIYKSFGIRKHVSEDIEDTVRQGYGNLEPDVYKVWRFDDKKLDWVSNSGELLTEAVKYHPVFPKTVKPDNTS